MDSDLRPAKRPGESESSSSKSVDGGAAKPTNQSETPFRTPYEVAADDGLSDEPKPTVSIHDPKHARKAARADKLSGWRQKLALHWPPGKKEAIVAATLLLVVLLGIGSMVWFSSDSRAPFATVKKAKSAPPKPTTVPSNLTGLQVKPEINQRPVTGVMIENSLPSRPQTGIIEAGVVFEAIAEAGITRFLTLYQDNAPTDLGPIRSARPYFVQWNLAFDAGYAHVGGSPDALAMIRDTGTRDLDQFANPGSYRRISGRPAPHNMYSSMQALNQLEASKGFNTSTYKGFVRKDKETPNPQPNARSIDFAISGASFNVHYDYVAGSNSYNRVMGGAPHVDGASGQQISPKVVVALFVPYGLAADRYHSNYAVVGTGSALIFQDGMVYAGNWSKPSAKDQITFTDPGGKPLKLNPGQTWLTALTDPSKVVYRP